MTGRIVVVGSINADLMLQVARHPAPGETIHGDGGRSLPGGKGANQAVAAALLGGDVAMVGAVGADPQAEAALAGLRGSGADITHVRTVEGPTGLAVVTVAADGENSIIVVPGANARMDADAVREAAPVITGADVLVMQGEIPRTGIEAAAGLIRGRSTRLVLNPAPVLDLDPQVLRQADPLVVNEHEAQLVLAQLERCESHAVADPAGLAASLSAAGPRSVVLTLGGRGALVCHAADGDAAPSAAARRLVQHVPAARVRAVDTTGAGDAFIGALAVSLADGDDVLTGARHGARVAGFAVQRPGAQASYPSAADELPELGETTTGQ